MIDVLQWSNGFDAIFIGTLLIAAVQLGMWAREDPRVQARGLAALWRHDALRILTGATILFVGVALRISDSFIRRAMLLDQQMLVRDAIHLFPPVTIVVGTLLVVIGTTLIMWPYLRDKFGRAMPVWVGGGTVMMWVVGVWSTKFLNWGL